ncbi:pentapeptide repeat-containing protein [Cytophaga aurantiaca]|uniref:pentapeptide repeat-containing protein n=1 Tax=Cytophaga aurantiaca TaxID=29530 RepID=UPI0003626D8D|nr:pentapeptide repeat-containing protein [Cytophaga aurantiaca]
MKIKSKPISKDYSNLRLEESEYDNQLFLNCDFTNAKLNGVEFIDCIFDNCNLSNASLDGAALKTCTFNACKMLGLSFSQTRDFGFEIHAVECNLSFASFDKKKLYKSTFKQCNMEGVNFTQADLSKSKLSDCNLLDALFNTTNLSGVDFRTNVSFLIHPEANNIKKARFQSQDLHRLLAGYNIIVD